MEFKKRVLLTTQSLVEYAGAEINLLGIATELAKLGYQVEVGTFRFGDPIKSIFADKNLNVKNIIVEQLDHEQYDLIWSQHAPTLYNVLFEKNIRADKILFSSLSPFEPLEAPPIFVNELNLCLANSFETRDQLIRENVETQRIYVFPNYAPTEFIEFSNKARGKLNKICVVSNHVPDEITKAKDLLEQQGIEVDIYGLNHTQQMVTPSVLAEYDCVVTIGKTVQFSLVMGLPVYCYDIHGGPGWLNRENYDTAKYFNFSGRGFNKKISSEAIAEDILNNFDSALEFSKFIKSFAIKEFNLTSNLKKLINLINSLEPVVYETIFQKSRSIVRYNRAFTREFEYKNYYKQLELETKNNLTHENNKIKDELEKTKIDFNTVAEQKKIIENQLNTLNLQLEEKDKEVEQITLQFENYKKLKEIEINQKEKNCIYLSELTEEKNRLIIEMQNTKMWRLAELLRKNRNRFVKVLKDPKLIIKKIRKKGYDFSAKVNILPDNKINTKGSPLVSVVIPIYDRTNVLIESIESILNQTHENIELLLVCDGSPKATLDIVRSYESNPKVRAFYFNNNSGNAVRGRNKAIKEAKGEFLAFQDSDDVAEPDRIKISLDYAEKYKADVIYGGWRAIIDGTRDVGLENNQEIYSPDCDYNMLKEICVPCQSTVMVRTDALRFVGGLKPVMKYREDHELWLRLAYFGYKFKSVPEVLTNLRLHNNNLELSFKDNDDYWREKTLEEHIIIRPLKPKIAYLVAGCGISGGLAVVLNHLNGLLSRGYDVMLITEDDTEDIDWFPNQKVPIVSINQVPDNLDIIVATYWTTSYTIEQIPAKRKFYFVQSDESKFFDRDSKESLAARESYNKDYEFLTMAKWIQEWLETEHGKKAKYVPNGVDLNVMNSVVPLVEKKKRLRVLLEGPINAPFKGMKEAFEVVKDLDCEVWCVSTAGKPDASWRCDRFFESVSMDKMKHIYSSCDVLLKMSSVESFCLPALEMMACGGTVVLNRFKGLEEFVIDGYNGLVVELGDIEGAKRAINLLIKDPKLRTYLENNALKTAKEWGWEKSIDILEGIFYPDSQLKEG